MHIELERREICFQILAGIFVEADGEDQLVDILYYLLLQWGLLLGTFSEPSVLQLSQ
jgi:hypothetical protein